MDFFIKKIFDGQSDELVHLQFQKFSRGKFDNRAMVRAKKVKDFFNITMSYEYANEIVRAGAEKLGDAKTKVSGVIVSTKDLTGEIPFSNKKQFMGIKQYVIDSEMSGKEISSLVDKVPKAFFGLSFRFGDNEIKIKPKAPKSAKPSNKGDGEISPDFCKIKTKDEEFAKKILFDVDLNKFKVVEINHSFMISDIIMPEGEKDPLIIREKAKRKGKISRSVKVDGLEMKEEKSFEA